MKFKRMKYTKETQYRILASGHYQGYKYMIVSHGTHPTAYVRIPEGHPYYKKDYSKIDLDAVNYDRDMAIKLVNELCDQEEKEPGAWHYIKAEENL